MREIKFRVWNGRKMQTVDTLDWSDRVVKNTGEIFRIYTGGYNYRADEDRQGRGIGVLRHKTDLVDSALKRKRRDNGKTNQKSGSQRKNHRFVR